MRSPDPDAAFLEILMMVGIVLLLAIWILLGGKP